MDSPPGLGRDGVRDHIDLNADLGEGFGDDRAVFPYVSSANIACGAHAGDDGTMDAALALAQAHAVTIGAHVGYEDRAGFGRVPMDVDRETLTNSITRQIRTLQTRAEVFGLTVRYVKPHGALYHRVASDPEQGRALVDAVRRAGDALELLVAQSRVLEALAVPNVCRHEFFADRGYRADGTLVPRGESGAGLDDTGAIVARTLRWVREGVVEAVEGHDVRITADSICVHGDNPKAVETARALSAGLTASGVRVRSWMTP